MKTDLLISSLEKHIPLSPSDKEFIISVCRERKVKKGQFLVYHGGICVNTHFVNEGIVRTYFTDIQGQEHIIQFALEGWWISDLQSFTERTPAAFNVQALENSEILEISYENMERVFETVPKMERYFRIITQRAFVTFQQRIVQNLSMRAEERYLAFQRKYPQIELRFPQKMVAEYLGISPEFLSKIKKRLMERGK
jgi:CRP/FNR family transcriptional regulator, anaerobic regulatory protein